MALRARAHKQLQAIKLRDLLESCPLVLVYQTLGNVRTAELSSDIEAQIQKQRCNDLLSVMSLKIKNTIGASAKGTNLTPVFQANNILVGWKPAGFKSSSNALSRRSDSFADVLGADLATSTSGRDGAAAAAATINAPPMNGKALINAIDLGLKLSSSTPVALLAAFYRGQQFRVSHLTEWRQLDEAKVYPELLGEIESVSNALCGFDSSLDHLCETLDLLQPDDVLTCLDSMAEGLKKEAGPAVAAEAAA